jgi:hypothetical protein
VYCYVPVRQNFLVSEMASKSLRLSKFNGLDVRFQQLPVGHHFPGIVLIEKSCDGGTIPSTSQH